MWWWSLSQFLLLLIEEEATPMAPISLLSWADLIALLGLQNSGLEFLVQKKEGIKEAEMAAIAPGSRLAVIATKGRCGSLEEAWRMSKRFLVVRLALLLEFCAMGHCQDGSWASQNRLCEEEEGIKFGVNFNWSLGSAVPWDIFRMLLNFSRQMCEEEGMEIDNLTSVLFFYQLVAMQTCDMKTAAVLVPWAQWFPLHDFCKNWSITVPVRFTFLAIRTFCMR